MGKKEKARVRVFFGEIEGTDETVQDALRSIAAAVNRTFQPNTTIIRTLSIDGRASEKQIAEQAENSNEADDQQAELGLDTDASSKPSKPSSQRPRKAMTYSFVKDLNLRPVDKQSIRDFYAEKQAADQQQQLTVVVYYLYRVLELENVTTNHVYCLSG